MSCFSCPPMARRLASAKRAGLFAIGWLAGLALLAGCVTPPVDVVPVGPINYPTIVNAPPQNGSLFSAARYRPAFEDPRARLPGDSLTVQITEKVTASQSSSASLNRSGSASGGVSALPGIVARELTRDRNFKLAGESENEFSGSGDNENANNFAGVITVTVQQVLPNGHLLVAGEKQIGVNNQVDVLRFSGTVDPRHIQPGNQVASTQVANARIESKGRGAVSEAMSMGWLNRFFMNVFPF